MAERIFLQCEARRLRGHEAVHGADLLVGLSWQFAWREGFTGTAAQEGWVQPWTWDAVAQVDFLVRNSGTGAAQLVTKPVLAPAAFALGVDATRVKALLAERTHALNTSGGAAAFVFELDNPDAMQPATGHVLQLQAATARTAAGMGHSLNMAAVAALMAGEMPIGAWNAAAQDLNVGWEVFATPRLTRGAARTPAATGPVALPSSVRFEWAYSPAAGLPDVAAVLRPVDTAIADQAGRYIQPVAGWVRRAPGTVEAPSAAEHWPTRLAERVEAAWDLPRQMLDAVRGLVSLPPAAFAEYEGMIVAALRDRAGLGLIDTPDGEGLLRYAMQHALLPGAAEPTADEAVIRDGRLRSLQARLRVYEAGVIDEARWRARLKEVFDFVPAAAAASRPVTVTWPPADADWLANPGTFDLAARAGGSVPANVTFNTVAGTFVRTADGGASFTFDLFQSAIDKPVHPGEVRVTARPTAGAARTSGATIVAARMAEALAAPQRLHTALRDRRNLAKLALPVWKAGAEAATVTVNPAAAALWFDTVRTTVAAAAPNLAAPPAVSVAGTGELRGLDGRAWVLTLRAVEWFHAAPAVPWPNGAEARLVFDPLYAGDGTPVAGQPALVLHITWQDAAGVLSLLLEWRERGVAGPVLASTVVPFAAAVAFDVRVEWTRGPAGASTLQGAAFVRPAGAAAWTPGPVVRDTTPPNTPHRFARLGLRIVNPGAVPLVAASPSLLVAPQSLADPRAAALAALWDADADPARSLWQETQAPHPDRRDRTRLVRALETIDMAEVLAAGQTARLTPVWHWTPPANDPDFFRVLNQQFKALLKAMLNQRFARGGADRDDSIFRDFRPFKTAGAGYSADLADIVDKHLEREAQDLPLPASTSASSYGPTAADRVPLPATHPLNLQAIEPGAFAGAAGSDADDDALRTVTGFGVLLRQAGPAGTPGTPDTFLDNQPWRMLNLADVGAFDSTLPADLDPVAQHPVAAAWWRLAAPVPLQYQDNARVTMISYASRPLAAQSPLVELAADAGLGVDTTAVDPVPFLKQPPSLPGAGHDWGLLPTLKFGQWYQALLYTLGNAGDLPPRLAQNTHPSRVRPDNPADAQFATPLMADFVRKLAYYRRVGVAAPRAFALDPNGQVLSKRPVLGELPRDVMPLAREWSLRGLSATQPPARWFHDAAAQRGDLPAPSRWEVVLPRVIVAGGAETDTRLGTDLTAPAAFTFTVGLKSPLAACGVTIARAADQLTITGSGPATTLALVSPAGGPQQAGALDFRIVFDRAFAVWWRRADRDEPWLAAAAGVAGAMTPNERYWLELAVPPRAVATTTAPVPAAETVLTFGLPEFGAEGPPVAVLQPTAALDVLTAKPVPRDPLAGAPTAAAVVTAWTAAAGNRTLRAGLRLPATDLDTWTAWSDMDIAVETNAVTKNALLRRRSEVWKQHLIRTPDSSRDGSLDDPAAPLLVLELRPLRTDRAEKVWRIAWKPSRPAAGFDSVQGALQKLHVQVLPRIDGVPASVALTAMTVAPGAVWTALQDTRLAVDGAGGIVVRLQEQEIWELAVHAAVPEPFFIAGTRPGDQRFHQEFGEAITVTHVDTVAYRLFAPWRVIVEAATPEVILPATPGTTPDTQTQAERKALLSMLRPTFDGRRVDVKLAKPSPRELRYAGEVQLLRQVWRWRGRPVPPFPFAAVGGPDAFPPAGSPLDAPDAPTVWDAAGFGDTSSADMLDVTRPVTTLAAAALLFREDLDDDRRALYYRFSAQARSRYAPLYPEVGPQGASEADPANAEHRNAWRRLVVPARRDGELPRPAVRFLVPLTEPDSDRPAARPGLLVVLDEAWFAHAGLAETLDAEIVETGDYFGTTGVLPPLPRPEFGPDPTLTEKGWTEKDVSGSGASVLPPAQALELAVAGPIGHTFDTDAGAPLFNASSFLLQPPQVPAKFADWSFAKIRFRRGLRAEAATDYRRLDAEPVAAAVTTDLALPADGSWVVDLPQVRLERVATAGSFTVDLDDGVAAAPDRSRGRLVAVYAADGTLTLAWTPRAAAQPVAVAQLAGGPWIGLDLDLRIILSLDPRRAAGAPLPTQPRHTAVQYRVRGLEGGTLLAEPRVWRQLTSFTWAFDGAVSWPAKLVRSATGTAFAAPPLAFPSRASAFTAPHWVQFLPDSAALLGPLAKPGLTLRWGPGPTAATCTLQTAEPDGISWATLRTAVDALATPPSGNFFRAAVLVTEVVADVQGRRDQERYVGLYRSDASLVRVHPLDSPARPPAARRVRVRIVEFQIINSPATAEPTWDMLFPDQPVLSGGDTAIRVVRVSPPTDAVVV